MSSISCQVLTSEHIGIEGVHIMVEFTHQCNIITTRYQGVTDMNGIPQWEFCEDFLEHGFIMGDARARISFITAGMNEWSTVCCLELALAISGYHSIALYMDKFSCSYTTRYFPKPTGIQALMSAYTYRDSEGQAQSSLCLPKLLLHCRCTQSAPPIVSCTYQEPSPLALPSTVIPVRPTSQTDDGLEA